MSRKVKMTDAVFTTGVELVNAMMVASSTWQQVCADFTDSRAWAVHHNAQRIVNEARALHTRAKVDARLASK